MSGSILYRHLWLYRAAMNLLYRGRYRARFRSVCGLLRPDDRSVLELCFGDVAIAEHCRRRGRRWTGLDLSEAFVDHARRRGFDARQADLTRPVDLPPCDVCVMMGSLYHFEGGLADLFRRIRACSRRFVFSEPVKNWSQSKGLLRFLARRLTRTAASEQTFRFDAASLTRALDALQAEVGFEYRIAGAARDMLVEVTWLK